MTGKYHFNKAWPLVLTAGIIGVDQLTKWAIVKTIPMNTVGWRFWNDFFRIIHVRDPFICSFC